MTNSSEEMLKTLKVIADGSFIGASDAVLQGRWQDFAIALQNFARDALSRASSPTAETVDGEMRSALQELHSFITAMFGHGPDGAIPETVDMPIGVPIKVGEIMRRASAAIARASGWHNYTDALANPVHTSPSEIVDEKLDEALKRWRPTAENRICFCVGGTVCAYHELTSIIDRLRARASAPAGVDGWKPIETALRAIKELHQEDDWDADDIKKGIKEWVARLDAYNGCALVRLEVTPHDRVLLTEFLRALPILAEKGTKP